MGQSRRFSMDRSAPSSAAHLREGRDPAQWLGWIDVPALPMKIRSHVAQWVRRPAPAIFAVAGLYLFFLLATGCSNPSQSPPQREGSQETAAQVLSGVTMQETSNGKIEWILTAGRATRVSQNVPTLLETLKVDFYQGTDRIRSTLRSDSGRVDSAKGVLVAMGRVVVVTPEGNHLETEELIWDRKSSRVTSDRFVRLIRGNDVLTGVGFVSNPNLTSYTLKKDIRASLHEDAGIRDELLGHDSTRSGR